jgi:hypothetical protein
MSLVSMASTWTNDEYPKRKRQSTFRIPKNKPFLPTIGEPDEYLSMEEKGTRREIEDSAKEAYQNMQPATFEDIQQSNDDRNKRVDELLNKITTVDSQENSKMGIFKPPENPLVQVRRDIENKSSKTDINLPSYADATQKMRTMAAYQFSADDSRLNTLSNYNKSYEMPPVLSPYYARGGVAATLGNNIGNLSLNDSKLMEKINYMIHMLEAQQAEKTSNITEEFILYTFLGVFIIYVVDSFARSGKYTR